MYIHPFHWKKIHKPFLFLSLDFVKISSLSILSGFEESVTMFQKVIMCCSMNANLLTARLISEGTRARRCNCLVLRMSSEEKRIGKVSVRVNCHAICHLMLSDLIKFTYVENYFLPEKTVHDLSNKSFGVKSRMFALRMSYVQFCQRILNQFLQVCGKSCIYT